MRVIEVHQTDIPPDQVNLNCPCGVVKFNQMHMFGCWFKKWVVVTLSLDFSRRSKKQSDFGLDNQHK